MATPLGTLVQFPPPALISGQPRIEEPGDGRREPSEPLKLDHPANRSDKIGCASRSRGAWVRLVLSEDTPR